MRKGNSYSFSNGKYRSIILLALLLFVNLLTAAQEQVTDSNTNKKTIPIAQNDIKDPIHYKAKDSMIFESGSNELSLYRDAHIDYQDMIVEAGLIVYEKDASVLNAKALPWEPDSIQNHILKKENDESKFTELRFNFKSQRASLSNAYSQYGEGFIKSEKVKRNKDESVFGWKNIYTTCNADTPHFGIAAKKVKIIPKKVAVSGSANLVIEEIPTPLFLPFGMFPLKQGQRSGFKLPTYSVGQNLGFGLREGGYYFALNDHWDLLALADIYTLGSWRVSALSKYNYRYKHRGSFSLNYAYNKLGGEFENTRDNQKNFFVTWAHQMDGKLHPGTTFSSNVNFGSSTYHTNNSYDPNFYLNNNYASSIAYSKTWAGKPFNLSVAARHNQNTGTGEVVVVLPEINFSANQLYPFRLRKNIITPRWYEKITASYQASAINELKFIDSLFQLDKISSNDFRNGIKHSLPVNATYNLFKYINANFSVNYNEYWYSRATLRRYNESEEKIDTNIYNGFFAARDFATSANFSTRIYGMRIFQKGKIKGIRHVLTPSVNFNYQPDFSASSFNYYYQSYLDTSKQLQNLSYFQSEYYTGPPQGKIGGVGFNLGNNLQLKMRGSDSTKEDKKVNIIDGLSASTFYNMAVDSFNWSNLRISYRTTLFQNINISGGLNYNPYAVDKNTGKRINVTTWKDDKKILRFENATMAIGASFPLNKNKMQRANDITDDLGIRYDNYVDFSIPYNLTVNYNMRLQKTYLPNQQKDTLAFYQDFNFRGDITLSPKWKLGLQSGYDFVNKEISYTVIDIFRDLHCWEIHMNLIPFGLRRSYNFSLNVKAAALQDLKLVRRRDFRDNF